MRRVDEVEPLDFLKSIRDKFPQFNNEEQHDAHEFLMALMNVLQQENIDDSPIKEKNYIENEQAQSFLIANLLVNNTKWYKDFLVLEQHSVSCSHCGLSSTWFQTSCCISIKVPNKGRFLEEIFSQITEDSIVSSCQSCMSPQQKKLRCEIVLVSKYIIIHLDRFIISNGIPVKNDAPVYPTPLKININNKMLQYRIKGVISHSPYGRDTRHPHRVRLTQCSACECCLHRVSRST